MKRLYGLIFVICIYQSIQLHASVRANGMYHRVIQEQIYKKQNMERQIQQHNHTKSYLQQLQQEILHEMNDNKKKQLIKQLDNQSKGLERATSEPLNNPDHPIFQRQYNQICAFLKDERDKYLF